MGFGANERVATLQSDILLYTASAVFGHASHHLCEVDDWTGLGPADVYRRGERLFDLAG